jgi:hypothetical protein
MFSGVGMGRLLSGGADGGADSHDPPPYSKHCEGHWILYVRYRLPYVLRNSVALGNEHRYTVWPPSTTISSGEAFMAFSITSMSMATLRPDAFVHVVPDSTAPQYTPGPVRGVLRRSHRSRSGGAGGGGCSVARCSSSWFQERCLRKKVASKKAKATKNRGNATISFSMPMATTAKANDTIAVRNRRAANFT